MFFSCWENFLEYGNPPKTIEPKQGCVNSTLHFSKYLKTHNFQYVKSSYFFFRCSSQIPWSFCLKALRKKTLVTKKPNQQNFHPEKTIHRNRKETSPWIRQSEAATQWAGSRDEPLIAMISSRWFQPNSVGVYRAPNIRISYESWDGFISICSQYKELIGHRNFHHETWGRWFPIWLEHIFSDGVGEKPPTSF